MKVKCPYTTPNPGTPNPGWYIPAGVWAQHLCTSVATVAVGNWRHFAGTFDGSAFRLYFNGAQEGELAYGYPLPSNALPLSFGGSAAWNDAGPGNYFNGTLAEIRLSSVPRSSNWLWATWFNIASNSDFVAVAVESKNWGTVFSIR